MTTPFRRSTEAPTRPAQEARLATFVDRIGRSPHRRRGRGSGRRPFLGRLPRRFGAGGPDPVGADARGWAGLVASDAGAGGADGQLPAARWAPAGGPGADVAVLACRMGRRHGAGRWLRLRALRSGGGLGRCGAGEALATGPVGGVQSDPVGGGQGRAALAVFRAALSSISTPSTTCRTGLGPMIISP
jgi:hypothetical protein